MTSNEALRTVAMACHGGADLDVIERRTRDLEPRDRERALRDLIVAGTVHRDSGVFHVRDHIESYCARCAQKLPRSERGFIRGTTIICTTCERKTT